MQLTPTSRTCLVTHRGCLDGTGSAFAFIRAGGLRENVLFKNPSGLILARAEIPLLADEVWYADCCPSDLTEPAGGLPFLVFDHHVSSMKKHGGDPRCHFDMNKSGTSIMSEVLGNILQPRLVEALEDYDLGRFEKPDGVFLADLANSFTQDEMLLYLDMLGTHIFTSTQTVPRVEAMANQRKIYGDSAIRGAQYGVVMGHSAGWAVSPVFWKNEVAQRILSDESVALAIIIDVTGGMISLRSRPNGPDCSELAARMGGGGHARAAGFKYNTQNLLWALDVEVFG